MKVTIDDIRTAGRLLHGKIVHTPTVHCPPLSDMLAAEVYLKFETLQRTGSFKDRGACVKLERLSSKQKNSGVIAMSAGNHAQGVAYHAHRLGIPATIVMPQFTLTVAAVQQNLMPGLLGPATNVTGKVIILVVMAIAYRSLTLGLISISTCRPLSR